jgi:ribosomal protein L37AE/L43A
LNVVFFSPAERTVIFPPQQYPRIDHDSNLPPEPPPGARLFASLTTPGILESVAGGAAFVLKKFPSFCLCSSVCGGNQVMSAGSPSKKSGMKTRYFWAEEVERMSAPCRVCGKKPKMSRILISILGCHACGFSLRVMGRESGERRYIP